MNKAVYSELMKLYQTGREDGFVYVNPKTGKGFVCVRKAFQSACRHAEIKNLILHDLRRTFATSLLNAGPDIITVQQLLGLTSVKTTQFYTMTNQEEKRHAASLLDGQNRGNLSHIWPTEKKDEEKSTFPTHIFSMN